MVKQKEDSLFQMYDNETIKHEQALALINGEWDREVVPRLPPKTAEMASRLGAFERSRKIGSSTDLLRGLLAYVSGQESWQDTGAWALLIKLAHVSASDWCKRLRQSRRWLEWLMTELIGSPASGKQSQADGSHGYRVWLVDATHVGEEGGTGNDWRLHTCYDWLAGRLASLKVTDVQGAEGFWHLPDAPRTIRVADRAYGYRDELLESCDHDQQAVVRVCPRTFPCLDADGTPFDIEGWLAEEGGASEVAGFALPQSLGVVRRADRSGYVWWLNGLAEPHSSENWRLPNDERASMGMRSLKPPSKRANGSWLPQPYPTSGVTRRSYTSIEHVG